MHLNDNDKILEQHNISDGYIAVQYWALNGKITIFEMETLKNSLSFYKEALEKELSCSSHVSDCIKSEIDKCQELLQKFTDYKKIGQ